MAHCLSIVNYFIEGLSFNRSAREAKVAFQINVDWTMEVVAADEGSNAWCSVEPVSGEAGLHKVVVRVARLDKEEFRFARLLMKCGDSKVAEITVVQEKAEAVDLGLSVNSKRKIAGRPCGRLAILVFAQLRIVPFIYFDT